MEFNAPSTKQEMYLTLQQIFNFYRVQRAAFEETELEDLSLEYMEFTPLTDQQLMQKASDLVNPVIEEKIAERKAKITDKLEAVEEELSSLEAELQDKESEIETLYSDSEDKITAQAELDGVTTSSLITSKIAELEEEKDKKITALELKYQERIERLTAKQDYYTELLGEVDGLYADLRTAKESEKFIELKEKQAETEREVFKYNNGIDEKTQRYSNSIAQYNANLQLKYMEISSNGFTKDQLIDMGYYEDVIECICDYYDTIANPTTAFQAISTDRKIHVYLEDFYEDVIYMYRSRAGL